MEESHKVSLETPNSFFIKCIALTILGVVLGLITLAGSNIYIESQYDVFKFLNHNLHFTPAAWTIITDLGDAMILLPLISLTLLISLKLWVTLWVSIPIASIFCHVGKKYFEIPRPAQIINQDEINVVGDILTASNSSPSGHSITIFTVVSIIIYKLASISCTKSRCSSIALACIIGCAVALSRVVVGAHWPLDTVFGAVLGICAGAISIYIVNKLDDKKKWALKTKYPIINLLLLFSLCLFLIVNEQYHTNPLAIVSVFVAVFTSFVLIKRAAK